jgi:hypothetical protein
MKTTMKNQNAYNAPLMEMYEMLTEQGFCLSGGSTVEQISGRSEEESWE